MEGYKYNRSIEVRYADVDMMRHVNNSKFLTYIEHARGSYFIQACNWDWYKQGMVLARMEIDFKKPILLNSKPVVWIRSVSIGKSSFTQQIIIAETGQPEVVYAEATNVMVHVDYTSGRPLPIPEKIKEAIRQYEDGLFH